MKKYGSRHGTPRAEKTVRKMLIIPFCAYSVQISTTFLLSARLAFAPRRPADVGLDELDRAIGAG